MESYLCAAKATVRHDAALGLLVSKADDAQKLQGDRDAGPSDHDGPDALGLITDVARQTCVAFKNAAEEGL
eukprot:4819080-Karenia_brevis.AAC.1